MHDMKQFIKENEGLKLWPYRCTADKLTIGYGHNLESNGISLKEAEFILQNDLDDVVTDLLGLFPFFWDFPSSKRTALADMRFNLGPGGFRMFKNMIAAAKVMNWPEAAKEARDSRWFHQVGKRSGRVISLLLKVDKTKGGDSE